jgi:hypothetical protein
MFSAGERFVPKMHPASRPVEAEDPMALHATAVAGDPDVLIRALVHEYAWMGWDADQIAALFQDPFYPLLHGLWLTLGPEAVRERIEDVFRTHGVYRFCATVHEAPEEEEPDVVQIGFGSWEGNRHAASL